MISADFCKTVSLAGETVSLEALLAAREQRAALQQQCVTDFHLPVLSVTLLAVGAVKKNGLLDTIFAHCLWELTACFAELGATPRAEFIRPLTTGHEALFVLPIAADTLKQAMMALEARSPLSRLWDLDVFDEQGRLLSRSDFGGSPRRCLVCERDAKICARERNHSTETILAEMQKRVLAETIADLARQALLDEVYLTPKPGLVDRRNNGSHRDMNVQTFERSAEALRPYFADCVRIGLDRLDLSPLQLFATIRPLGQQAEQAMWQATGGVNTHKGAIFAFGLACTALGRLLGQGHYRAENWLTQLCDAVAEMTQGVCRELEMTAENQPLTAGMRLFRQFGLTGARGEAEKGFPLVRQAWAFWKNLPNVDDEHRLRLTLLFLMAHNQDTNVVHRGGLAGLTFVQQQAQQILADTQRQDKETLIAKLTAFDTACIRRNLSSGGSADLLGLTWFFILLDRILFTF